MRKKAIVIRSYPCYDYFVRDIIGNGGVKMQLERLSKSDLLVLVEYTMHKDADFAFRIKEMLTNDSSTEGIDQTFDQVI